MALTSTCIHSYIIFYNLYLYIIDFNVLLNMSQGLYCFDTIVLLKNLTLRKGDQNARTVFVSIVGKG